MNKQLHNMISKVKSNPEAARAALFSATRKGTKGMSVNQVALGLIAASVSYLSF